MFICTKRLGQSIDDRLKMYEDYKKMVDWVYGRNVSDTNSEKKYQKQEVQKQSTD